MDTETLTMFCGNLFTQGGAGETTLTDGDILGSSEAFRKSMDYFSHSTNAKTLIEPNMSSQPRTDLPPVPITTQSQQRHPIWTERKNFPRTSGALQALGKFKLNFGTTFFDFFDFGLCPKYEIKHERRCPVEDDQHGHISKLVSFLPRHATHKTTWL